MTAEDLAVVSLEGAVLEGAIDTSTAEIVVMPAGIKTEADEDHGCYRSLPPPILGSV